MVIRLLRFLERHGHPLAPAFAAADLAPDALTQRARLYPLAQSCRLHAHVAEVTGDPAIGLQIAQEAAPSDYGLVGLIWAHHPTLDAALDALSHYYSLFLEGAAFDVHRSADVTRVVSRWEHEHPGLDVLRIEAVAAIYLKSREVSGVSWTPLAVRFRQAPLPAAPFEEVFGITPEFGAEQDELLIDPAHLRRPIPSANPALLAHLLEAAETHLARRREAARAQSRRLQLRGCVVDLDSGVVETGGSSQTLTTKERALLEYFADRPNAVVSHDDLERDVWGIGRTVITHAPAVAIRRLRQKIEPKGRKPVNLVTVFGEGWRLVVPEAETP